MEFVLFTLYLLALLGHQAVFAAYTDDVKYLKYSNTGRDDISEEEIRLREQAAENSSKKRFQVLNRDLATLIHDGIPGLVGFTEGSKAVESHSELDCRIKELAFQYAKKILSPSANFQAVFDALQLGALCNQQYVPYDSPPYRGHMYILGDLKRSGARVSEFFVDPVKGHDFQVGSLSSPFRNIVVAIKACRQATRDRSANIYCIVYLRKGIHFLTETLKLGPRDSNLIITRFLDENAVISTGKKLTPKWKLYKYDFEVYPLENNLFEGIKPGESTKQIKYIGKFSAVKECVDICSKDIHCTGFTYFNNSAGDYSNLCYHRLDGQWKPFYHTEVTSGKKVKIYVADLSEDGVQPFDQVFINDKRAVRARFPNGDPETTGLHTAPTGYVSAAASWIPPKQFPAPTEIHIEVPSRSATPFQKFNLGIGGTVYQFDPPKSYWGTKDPAGGGGAMYVIPTGLTYTPQLEMDRRSWTNPEDGIVHAFQHYHWGNWQFKLDGRDKEKRELHWSYGGFQEARGNQDGKEWYVENILEELDVANEWYLNSKTMHLYYSPNGTDLPSEIIVPQSDSVVSIIGSQDNLVKNVSLLGLTFAHTSITFMRKYEVPSGGDWAVHKNAMVFVENIDGLLIDGCNFSSPGGNGLYLRGYVRNATVSNNELFKLGENGIVLVGTSNLIDGTDGNQPRGTKILKNMVRDNGVWGKQTYAFVQSVAWNTLLEGNVFFNGPRGGININDGFGGKNTISQNLLFNFVRETLDHGPINTWDRQPYLYTNGQATELLPLQNLIFTNFIINNYGSTWPIDHDDGSCYWMDYGNFLVYGGFKNYLGHNKVSHDNVYVYPDGPPASNNGFQVPFCADTAGQSIGPRASGYGDVYVGNKCILNKESLYRLGSCNLADLKDTIPFFQGNVYYTPTGNASVTCGSAVLTLKQFQSFGYDLDTIVEKLVDTEQIIQWGKDKLGL